MRNNRQLRSINYFYIVKSFLIILTLILLSIILFQLNDLYKAPAYREKENLESITISLLIASIFLISTLTIFTLKEYISYIRRRRSYTQSSNSYLSLEDIFENENRLSIINQILRNPGIHHNELLRNCNLQKGQLQWHLDVLLKYRIIKKEKYGQYTIYFPITSSIESIDAFKNQLIKSKTTTKILKLIQNYPGISSSEISKKINLARNTVKYHIDKLSEDNLIRLKENGRKIVLYPNV